MITIFKRKYLVSIILAFVLLVSTVHYASAGGAGGSEPGGNCPDSASVNYQYNAPPYTGTMTVVWNNGFVYVSGLVEQVGQGACVGNIPANAPILFGAMGLSEFHSLQPNDIRGVCLVGYDSFFNCGEIGYFEIVGAGKIKYTSETSLTMESVIMHLQQR